MQTGAVQDIQSTIWGGPLSIRIHTDLAFGGILPGREDHLDWLKSWVEETMLPPLEEVPLKGEVKFDGRRFHYRSIPIWVPRVLRGWRRPIPGHWAYWDSEEAAEYLEGRWLEEFGDLFEEDPPPAPSAPIFPPLSLAVPAEPLVAARTEKPALWDESRMAEAMGLTEAAFVERLESGYWMYKYSNRIETWDESKRPLKVVKYRYSFTEAVRSQNIKNKDKQRRVVEED